MKKEWKSWWVFFLLGVFLLPFMLSSCKTKKVIEYRDSIVTQYITKIEKDTFTQNVHDSVYLEVIKQGDTVFVTKYKERTAYKDRVVIRKDTLWRDNTVVKEKEVTKEVTKVPSIYKYALGICIILFLIIIFKIIRWIQQRMA